MEKCDYTLYDFIEIHNCLPCQLRDITEDLNRALTHVHAKGVVHNDIHDENIFLKWCPNRDRYVTKLGDFGYSEICNDPAKIKADRRAMRSTLGSLVQYLPAADREIAKKKIESLTFE